MSEFPDHFSQSAALYALHRPTYPASLFEWLADNVPVRERAWDCGTGSGQAAVAVASHFNEVIATDPSHAQLVHAAKAERVHYAAMTAENSALRVNLITVAQALHWFDQSRFYSEVQRILAPSGILAVWTYGLLSITPDIDVLMKSFYKETIGSYWPAERALVDAGYAGIEFPFTERSTPVFEMERNWTLGHLAGYMDTWSAVARYQKANGESPVKRFIATLEPLWGASDTIRRITWPLELRVGSI